MEKTRIFFDTSALFAGIWSSRGGARELLKLGEAGAVQLVVSRMVLAELERALARKAPELLPRIALLLDVAGIGVLGEAAVDQVEALSKLTEHEADAAVVAAAIAASAELFVTLDRQHFLDNEKLKQKVPFPIVTPGQGLRRVRQRLAELTRSRAY